MDHHDPRDNRVGLSADGSGPLPRFEMGAGEASDPDRTLERLPRIDSSTCLLPEDELDLEPDESGVTAAFEEDLAQTVEITPDAAKTMEIKPKTGALVVLESERLLAASPALAYPPRAAPIDLDVLLARSRAEAQKSPEYFPRPTPLPPQAWAASTVPDDGPPEARTQSRAAASSGRRTRWMLGAGLLAATLFGIAIVHASVQAPAIPHATQLSVPAPLPTPSPEPATLPQITQPGPLPGANVPTVSVQSLPRVMVGTISLAAAASMHRLFVDGKVAPSGSQVVKCGVHVVQVGSRGIRRYVTVPCGEEVVVAN